MKELLKFEGSVDFITLQKAYSIDGKLEFVSIFFLWILFSDRLVFPV